MESTIDTQSETASQNQAQKPSYTDNRKQSSPEAVVRGQLGDPEFEVRQFMKNYAQAVREGNLGEILSFFSDDIEAFDCPPPLAFHGIREYSQNWISHYASEFKFPVTYDFVDEKILANEKLATFICLVHMQGVSRKTNEEIESWLRMTCVLEKSQGYWQIVHDHLSVPVSDEGSALMNLRPEDNHQH